MLLAFVPMMFVAIGYQQLNKEMPDCGTTFTWGAKAFGPTTGWMGGWGIIAADVIVMANLAPIAGQYMFQLFGADGLAASNVVDPLAGVAWIVVMCCHLLHRHRDQRPDPVRPAGHRDGDAGRPERRGPGQGVRRGSAGRLKAHPPGRWSLVQPVRTSTFSALTPGMLIAVFIYWGWDTAVSVNEETKDKERTPGRAAVTVHPRPARHLRAGHPAAQAFAGIGHQRHRPGQPRQLRRRALGPRRQRLRDHGFGWFLAKLLVLMVLTSAAASTLTTILPTARTTLSMAAYKAASRPSSPGSTAST